MRDAMHTTATATAIQAAILLLATTGNVAGLPDDGLAPDPVDEAVRDVQEEIVMDTPLQTPEALSGTSFRNVDVASLEGPPRWDGHDVTTTQLTPPDPVSSTSSEAVRHTGQRTVSHRSVAAPPQADGPPPVWWPGTAGVLVLAAAMYHRLDRDDLLDNEVRAAILDAVEDDPGGTVTEYAEAADVDRTTARYHLRMLERFDYVLSDRIRGRTRYFENHGRWGRFARQAIAHLRDRSTRKLVTEVLEEPGRCCRDLADPTGLSESAVYRKIGRLDEIGLVEVEGRPKRVRPPGDDADRVARLVEVAAGS